MRNRIGVLGVGAAAIAMLTVGVAPASAAPLSEPDRVAASWPAQVWSLDSLQASGATGEGVKIAVIDTYLNPDVAELQGANVQVKGTTCVDPATGAPREIVSQNPGLAEHGTNVVSMLVGNGKAADGGTGARGIAPKSEVWFYGVGDLNQTDAEHCKLQDPTLTSGGIDLSRDISWSGGRVEPNSSGQGDATALAARAAIRDGADVISVSTLSGTAPEWSQVIFEAQIAQIPIVVGVMNPDVGFKIVGGPWLSNGAFPVNAIDSSGELLKDRRDGGTSYGGENLAIAAPGSGLLGVGNAEGWGPTQISGTSYATPLTAGAAALGFQKYPNASRFQVMQAMLRTTGVGDLHDLKWVDDGYGTGILNPGAMLAVDPSQFPDENPQWVKDVDDPRCASPDGTPGSISDNGQRICQWAPGPFEPGLDAYRAVYVDGQPMEIGKPEESPYLNRSNVSTTDAGQKPSAEISPVVLAASVGGGVVLLAGIVAAIVIPISVSKKRRQNQAGGSSPLSGGHS